tara:strand:+ start:483 stop:701 length:219 start_codon:yes stop_codon:yes gene_type:complete
MKELIILILMYDGTLIHQKLTLPPINISVHQCLEFSDKYREHHSIYKTFEDPKKNGHYLKDGRGTIQGFICQ